MLRRSAAVAVVAMAGLVSACGQGAQPAPGAKVGAVDPVVLRLASGNTGTGAYPALQRFLDGVKEGTDGRVVVRISFFDVEGDRSEPELVSAVASGKSDLGWVAVRSMPTAGVPAFGALEAPLLIDDYAVQRAVLTSDVPQRLLKATAPLGVEGLAILGDHLRNPVADKKPLVDVADFAGAPIWVNRTAEVQQATVRALGGTQPDIPFSELLGSMAMGTVAGTVFSANNLLDNDFKADYLTANVNLWPRNLLLMANPGSLAKLTSADADAVRAAAADAAKFSLTVGPDSDVEQLAALCSGGTRAVLATDTQLSDLRAAVQPVYAELRRDPETAAILDRIAELKAAVKPEPIEVPAACLGGAPATASAAPVPARAAATPTVLDGAYRQVVTADDLRRVGFTEATQPNGKPCLGESGPALNCLVEDAGTFTYTFDRGTYTWTQRQTGAKAAIEGSGYYLVDGSTLVIVDDEPRPDGSAFVQRLTWSQAGGGALTVTPDDEWNVSRQMASAPWQRVS